MKVKGISVTQPVCDLRPLVAPGTRLDCFNAGPLHPKVFLRGFGKAGERFRLRIPWRPTDTIYIDCGRAISLPDVIPIDERHVYRILRRVYFDGFGLVRFELGFFLHPKHHSPRSKSSWQEYAQAFWAMEVVTKLLGRRKTVPLFKALESLVEHFADSTTPHKVVDKTPESLCHPLNPQLQVMVDIGDVVYPEQAIPLDSEHKTFLGTDVVRVRGRPEPVDAACLLSRREVDLKWRRLVRAHISCLHADLEALSFLVQHYKTIEPPAGVVAYVERLASGLRAAPGITDADRLAILSLLKAAGEVQANRRSRLAAAVETSRFPGPTKTKVREALHGDPESGNSPAHKIHEQLREVGQLETMYRRQRLGEVARKLLDVEVEIASRPGCDKALRDRRGLRDSVKIIESELLDPEQIPSEPDVSRFIEANRDKIRELADYFRTYYTGPTEKSLVGYLKQFRNVRWIELTLKLLDRVEFFDEGKIGNIFCECVGDLFESTNGTTIFVPLGGPRDSASLMTYICGKALQGKGSRASYFLELKDAIKTYVPRDVSVIFIDDNVGSGKQATRIFSEWFDMVQGEHKHVAALQSEQREWLRACPHLYYFVVVGFSEGMDELMSALGSLRLNLGVRPALLKREVEGCFDPASTVFRTDEDREEAREMAKAIGYQLLQDKDHWSESKKRERALGYGDSQKLIVFSHNTPPSTLPIFWKGGWFNGSPWIPLFPRR